QMFYPRRECVGSEELEGAEEYVPWRSRSDRAQRAAARALGSAYTSWMPWFFNGTERMRLPVALKNAFSTAGAATQIVGSPIPPQNPPDGITIDSTFGICAIRIESKVWKFSCTMRPSLTVHSSMNSADK